MKGTKRIKKYSYLIEFIILPVIWWHLVREFQPWIPFKAKTLKSGRGAGHVSNGCHGATNINATWHYQGAYHCVLFSIRMMAKSPTKCDLVGPSIAKNGEKMARVAQPHQLNLHLWQHHCPAQTPGAATASVEPPSLCERPTSWWEWKGKSFEGSCQVGRIL